MRSRKELTRVTAQRYRAAQREAKTKILDEFCASSGYNRAYAAMLLRGYGKPSRVQMGSDTLRLQPTKTPRKAGGRPPIYGRDHERVAAALWKRFGYIAAARLVVVIRASLGAIRADPFLRANEHICRDLARMSSATLDRLLRSCRKKLIAHGRSLTRSSGLLTREIPIRTFGEWKKVTPGYVQMDTVGHEGGNSAQGCAFTLCLTDVCSGWTERRAVANRGIRAIRPALEEIRSNMPFPLVHLHTDNGSEFINYSMLSYCKSTGIGMSRSRAGKKNDNCWVEQKNFDTVRKLTGYARYDTPEAVELLNTLYRTQAVLQNYVYPSQKLIEKIRIGSRQIRRFDAPKTPAMRILDHPQVPAMTKKSIRLALALINPLQLADRVCELQCSLLSLAHRYPAESSEKQVPL